MLDTRPLEQQIQNQPARTLETDAPEINEILALAEHNEILAAAEKAQRLWEAEVYDVRTLGCYLGGVFLERGLSSLSLLLDCLLKTLTLNWEYLGPSDRKQRLCDVSLRWLFTTLISQIEFHQKAKGAQWERWNEGWSQSGYNEAADRCVQLSLLLDEVIPKSRSRGPLLNFKSVLNGIVRPSNETAGWKAKMTSATIIPAPPPPPPRSTSSSSSFGSSSESSQRSGSSDSTDSRSSSSGSSDGSSAPSESSTSGSRSDSSAPPSSDSSSPSRTSASDESSNKEEPAEEKEPEAPSAAPPAPPGPTGESVSLPLSPALRALMRQLDGFLLLLQKGQMKRAAILYREIKRQIDGFDPRFYLPSLFGAFYAQLAQHGPRLAASLKEPSDLSAEALTELCRVDLDLFLRTEAGE